MATRDNPLKIVIYTEADYIVVKNNLQRKAVHLKSTGIGLKNLSERVRLITGKVLITEESNSEFIVKIPLIS
jgi:two-component system LytT family sensor kinase